MANRLLTVCATLLVPAVMLLATASAQQQQHAPLAQGVEEFMSWLPVSTETIVVAQAPFDFPDIDKEPGSFPDLVRRTTVGSIAGIDETIGRSLTGQRVLLAVLGSCEFRTPKGLGMMPFSGAEILRFDPAAGEIVERAFLSLLEKAATTRKVEEEQVALFTMELENDIWSLWVSQPEDAVLVVATDERYLAELLRRRKQRPKTRAMPDDLREWHCVDVQAPIWGFRHYRAETAQTDPSSPLGAHGAWGLRVPDAVGLTFWWDDSTKVVNIRDVLASRKSGRLLAEDWRKGLRKLRYKVDQPDGEVVELSVTLSNDSEALDFWFVLMGRLGHAIYL